MHWHYSSIQNKTTSAPNPPPTHLLHRAWGKISPNTNTAVTEMTIAVTGSASRSRNSGSVSIATALQSSSVTSRKCWLRIRGRIPAAYRCSWGVPLRRRTLSAGWRVCGGGEAGG